MRKAICVLMCWLLSPSLGYAQSDWEAVKALAPGTPLRIDVDRGRYAEGTLQAIDDTQITIVRNTRVTTASRAEVRQVERVGARQTAKRAGWGLVIGAVGGAILGYAATETNKGAWAARMALGWGAIGGVIGAIDGVHARERTVVYRR